MLRRTIAMVLLGLWAALPSLALAHGSQQHVMGTLEAVDDDRLVVETKDGKSVSIAITGKTRFTDKDGAPAERSDLRAGDRVVVDVVLIGGSHVADAVRFAHPEPSSTEAR